MAYFQESTISLDDLRADRTEVPKGGDVVNWHSHVHGRVRFVGQQNSPVDFV